MSQYRAFTHWIFPAYTLGLCKRFTTSSDIAQWISRLDGMLLGYAEGAAEMREEMRRRGMQELAAGEADDDGKDTLAFTRFCRTEVAAIRSIINSAAFPPIGQ